MDYWPSIQLLHYVYYFVVVDICDDLMSLFTDCYWLLFIEVNLHQISIIVCVACMSFVYSTFYQMILPNLFITKCPTTFLNYNLTSGSRKPEHQHFVR